MNPTLRTLDACAHGWVADEVVPELRRCPTCSGKPTLLHDGFGVTIACDNCYSGERGMLAVSSFRRDWASTERAARESWNEQVDDFDGRPFEDAVVHAMPTNAEGQLTGYPITIRCTTWERAREWADSLQGQGYRTRILYEEAAP